MDRCGTQTSVTLHSDLKIAAVNTKPMAIEEIDSDETLGMDDTLEVLLTRGPEDSEARGSRDPVAHPVETSIAQRTAARSSTLRTFLDV